MAKDLIDKYMSLESFKEQLTDQFDKRAKQLLDATMTGVFLPNEATLEAAREKLSNKPTPLRHHSLFPPSPQKTEQTLADKEGPGIQVDQQARKPK